jgi:hypothetical protein
MKKIPTIFERDWKGDRSRVVDQINPAAQWVFDGEGIATRKLDGTSCMIRDGKLYKRREATAEQVQDNVLPGGFELVDQDPITDKVIGWVPIGDGPEDKWHREALADGSGWPDGTYELVGPKIQGNPERATSHKLVNHADPMLVVLELGGARTFNAIRAFFSDSDMEGVVYHHPDGRMAKIKGRDFGYKRSTKGN